MTLKLKYHHRQHPTPAVFVTPEYNYSASASLMNAIQCLLREWAGKPAGIVSYGGISGGLRVANPAAASRQSERGRFGPIVPVPVFPQFIGDDGLFRPNEQMRAGAKTMFEQLYKWAGALKAMRETPAA